MGITVNSAYEVRACHSRSPTHSWPSDLWLVKQLLLSCKTMEIQF